MNIEDFRDICLSVKGATECFPFDETILVFKVMGKMFAYTGLNPKDGQFKVNMKCTPDRSIELREMYDGVKQCVHSRSLLWNEVYLDSDLPDALIKKLVEHSVSEVILKLPKKKREEYFNPI